MIASARGDGNFIRTARRYRTIEIQAGSHTIIAADPLPDDIRHAIETITRAADLRTNLAQLGSRCRRPRENPAMYEPVTAENAVNAWCGHLLTTIGLASLYPRAGQPDRRVSAPLGRRDVR